jgi:3-hydroxybutyrate dehydrogenase
VHIRNILITGGGSGIGAGLAVHLTEAGHRIVVTDLDGAGLQHVSRLEDFDPARSEHDLPEERVINDIMLRPMPKRSFITIAEIAAAVEYFLSDAARNVTAQVLALDGGWTAA